MVLYTYWKQRLYSYILGKVLQPYLENTSVQKLCKCITEVSIQDGYYILNDLQLNVQYLNTILYDKSKSKSSTVPLVLIRQATIHRLEIQISLQENTKKESDNVVNNTSNNYAADNNDGNNSNNQDDTTNTFSNFVWKAFQLGISTSTNTNDNDDENDVDSDIKNNTTKKNTNDNRGGGIVSLVVHIIIDGITIEFEPSTPPQQQQQQRYRRQQQQQESDDLLNNEQTQSSNNNKSIMSAYIDSIMKSLRLSVDINDLYIRFNSHPSTKNSKNNNKRQTRTQTSRMESHKNQCSDGNNESWIQFRIYSISYYDIVGNDRDSSNATTTTGTSTTESTIINESHNSYRTKLHKALSFNDRITIVSGDRIIKHQKLHHEQSLQQQQQQQSSMLTWVIGDTAAGYISGGASNAMDDSNNNNSSTESMDNNVLMIAEIGANRDNTIPANANRRTLHPEISLHVIEYNIQQQQQEQISSSDKHNNNNNSNNNVTKRVQNSISIELSQAVNFLIDSTSIRQIQTVVNAYLYIGRSNINDDNDDDHDDDTNTTHEYYNNDNNIADTKLDDHSSNQMETKYENGSINNNNNNNKKDEKQGIETSLLQDWNDIQAVMMKQYEEARVLAEKNVIVGGMLFPSITGYTVDGKPDITYDAFFDANDGGFSQCISDLQASITMSSSLFLNQPTDYIHDQNQQQNKNNTTTTLDWCHTKFRLHLNEGGFKILLATKPTSAATTTNSSVNNNSNQIASRSEEYILLTFSDLNITSSIRTKSMDHVFSISELEVEDSNVKMLSNDPRDRVVEIGSLIRFNPRQVVSSSVQAKAGSSKDEMYYEDDDSVVIVATPCISLHYTSRTADSTPISNSYTNTARIITNDCNNIAISDIRLSLEPIELTYRQTTISKMLQLLEEVKTRQDSYTPANEDSNPSISNDCEQIVESDQSSSESISHFVVLCSSIALEIIVPMTDDDHGWVKLYDRCGYEYSINDDSQFSGPSKCKSTQTSSSAVGLHIDKFELDRTIDTRPVTIEQGTRCLVTCHSMIAYTNIINLQRRFDVLALCGRSEVEPHTLISLDLWQSNSSVLSKDSKNVAYDESDSKITQNKGTLSVPHVVPISNFKTRQADDDDDEDNGVHIDGFDDDDDDEDHSDWVVSSIRPSTTELHNASRKPKSNDDHWRSARVDPENRMKNEASESEIVVSITFPEVVCDVSTNELQVLLAMFERLQSLNKETEEYHDVTDDELNGVPTDPAELSNCKSETVNVTSGMTINVSFDCGSFILHGVVPSTIGTRSTNVCTNVSYCFNFDQFQFHTLFFDHFHTFRHCRILAHELNFLEVSNLVRPLPSPHTRSVLDRLFLMSERRKLNGGSFATPLLYRSQLFPPISRSHPTKLLDIMNGHPLHDETTRNRRRKEVSHINVYFTAYDLTHRFNYESLWVERLKFLVKSFDREVVSDRKLLEPSQTPTSTIALTRMFLNCLDCNVDYTSSLRFATASRTIVRVGDVRVSSNILQPRPSTQSLNVSIGDVSVYLCNSRFPYNYENRHLLRATALMRPDDVSMQSIGLSSDCDSIDVIRSMDNRSIIDVDYINATLSLSSKQNENVLNPNILLTLRIGEARVAACKDSFAIFMSTIGEMSTDASNVTDNIFEDMKAKSVLSVANNCNVDDLNEPKGQEELAENNIIQPQSAGKLSIEKYKGTAHETSVVDRSAFLLDGYDWTTIEISNPNPYNIPDDEDQVAKWYDDSAPRVEADVTNNDQISFSSGFDTVPPPESNAATSGPNMIQHHFALQSGSEFDSNSDIGAKRYAGTEYQPQVNARVLVHDFSCKVSFFDGYDWPGHLDINLRTGDRNAPFVIPEVVNKNETDVADNISKESVPIKKALGIDKKMKLMSDLLQGTDNDTFTFSDIPLPEERSKKMKEDAEIKRLSRNPSKFLQFGVSGLTLRVDTFDDMSEHLLASCVNIRANDFMLVETISTGRPVRMAGEWLNDKDHPRDSREGLFMMKMITWRPVTRINANGDIANDESEATLKILPLRCVLDQRAIAFARALFQPTDGQDTGSSGHAIVRVYPPPLFRIVRIRSFKVKVDYIPSKLDAKALRDGSLVELVNLTPIDSMVLTLQAVDVHNEIGLGTVLPIVVRRWVQDICSTQITKFLTNARPFEPITHVSGAAVDLVVLPWNAFKDGRSIQKALRAGTRSFSETILSEAFTVSSRVVQYVGGQISKLALGNDNTMIPDRPYGPPKGMIEATPHAIASISRGLRTANYKIMIIPYREYRRSGARGAVTSVLKGIPIAVAAPTSAAAEALSFTLLAARNQLLPDIRKEEEAIQLKHHH